GTVGLRLLELEPFQLPDAFHEALARDGDRAGFARAVTGFTRAFTEPSLAAGLDPARPPQERAELLDALYERLQARAERRPDGVRGDWRVAAMLSARPA